MKQYLIQSYYVTDGYQPSVMQYVQADNIRIEGNIVIFENKKIPVGAFDLTSVFFLEIPEDLPEKPIEPIIPEQKKENKE